MQIKVVPLGAGQVSHKLSRHKCGALWRRPRDASRILVSVSVQAEAEGKEEEGQGQEEGEEDGRVGENSKLCEWRIAMQITMDNVCRHEAMTIPPPSLYPACRMSARVASWSRWEGKTSCWTAGCTLGTTMRGGFQTLGCRPSSR